MIDRAIGFEDEMSHSHGGAHEHGVELFTRGVQGNIGMGFGVLAFAVAMGALMAVVFAVVYGRLSDAAARPLAARIAGSMLVCLYLVPALKYPPNPPAVSLEETIRQRTLLYLLMVVLSAALFVAAVVVRRRIAGRLDGWNATLIAAGGYVVAMAVVMLVLPTIDETPDHFPPADLLYEFRLYSLGTQVVMWVTLGAVFAALMYRLLEHKQQEPVAA